MRAWDEFVAFARGTRPRPPPGPQDPRATGLLVTAALLHLPIVYLLVRDATQLPVLTLAVGLLAMGLAWSGGVTLEGRRAGTVRALAALGVAEGALAFTPPIVASLGNARWLFLGILALSLGALLATRR